jgi:single-strand DNA-binding protein
MNKVIIIGRLTKDVELLETQGGTPLARLSVAVNRSLKNSDGEREADFFNVTVWGNQAENCRKYLEKGRQVAIQGDLRNDTYTDKNGDKRTSTTINAQEVEFIGSAATSGEKVKKEPIKLQQIEDDGDLPF